MNEVMGAYFSIKDDTDSGHIKTQIVVAASNREELIDYLKKATTKIPATEQMTTLMQVRSACGHTFDYKTEEDIPSTSHQCSCGNPGHWFIKYGGYLDGDPHPFIG